MLAGEPALGVVGGGRGGTGLVYTRTATVAIAHRRAPHRRPTGMSTVWRRSSLVPPNSCRPRAPTPPYALPSSTPVAEKLRCYRSGPPRARHPRRKDWAVSATRALASTMESKVNSTLPSLNCDLKVSAYCSGWCDELQGGWRSRRRRWRGARTPDCAIRRVKVIASSKAAIAVAKAAMAVVVAMAVAAMSSLRRASMVAARKAMASSSVAMESSRKATLAMASSRAARASSWKAAKAEAEAVAT